MTDPLKKARDMRRAGGDTSPGFGLQIDETWEWPLSLDQAGQPAIDPEFFTRVREQTGQALTAQQATGVLEIWYKQALRPRGFRCPIMEKLLADGSDN